MRTRRVELDAYSPEAERITPHGEQVPLAGNFTAAYGLWWWRRAVSPGNHCAPCSA